MALIKIYTSSPFSRIRRRRVLNGGVFAFPRTMGCTLLFNLIIKPDFYPERKYEVKVCKTFLENDPIFAKIFKIRKIASRSSVLDFIYEIFTNCNELEIESKNIHKLIQNIEDYREFENDKFDDEILAGLEEVLGGNLGKLDNEGKFILEHIKIKKCALQ